MSDRKVNPKHSVGKGAQSEHHNKLDEDSYVDDTKEESEENESTDGDYLEQKWRKIATDFQRNYNMDVKTSEYKDETFSETLKRLENKTGKSEAELRKEIDKWN